MCVWRTGRQAGKERVSLVGHVRVAVGALDGSPPC